MDISTFHGNLVESERILYTPSAFARSNLLHLQEIGELKVCRPHISKRENLSSYLFLSFYLGQANLSLMERAFLFMRMIVFFRLPYPLLASVFRKAVEIKMAPFLWSQYEQNL